MKIIDDFIRQYNKEFDFYQELSKIVATKVENQFFKQGIKAIVTYRAKRPDRLKEKLVKRNEEKNYQNNADIFADIIDLSGVRISLYFPSERDVLDEIINELFIIDHKKVFPTEAHTPKHDKRFSGYWATHYRVKLKSIGEDKRYFDAISEIQVASVLMHAWSEVEHDLVYKPFSGDLSKEELAILDEINGLVLSGEIALERLQKAMTERTKQKNEITDKYELTNTLINYIQERFGGKIKLGDTYVLDTYLKATKKLNTEEFYYYLTRINSDAKESATDQLLNMWLTLEDARPLLRKYFKNLNVPDKRISSFEAFVRCWVILEKAVREILNNSNLKVNKYLIPDFTVLREKNIIDQSESYDLQQLRQIRNFLLHGIDSPPNDYLEQRYIILKGITKKIITKVANRNLKTKLNKELNNL